MKFETKMTKLGIDENEVKSIIANCECGEVNGAYFFDLTKMRKWEIMEVIGNDLDADLYSEGEFYSGNKKMSAFCKAYGIEESEIADYFALGISNQGCDIAYTLESNKDVILVLTDDERYHNSFIKYSPSQNAEEESEPKVLIRTIENQEYSNNGDYIENIEQYLKTEGFEIDESTIVYEDTPFLTCTEDVIKFIESAEITYMDDNRFYSIKQDQTGDYMVYTGKRDNTQKLEDYLSDNLFDSKNLESELESLISQYDAKIDELTQLDNEIDVDKICTDKQLMNEYESKKAEIENEISEIEEQIEKAQELEESQMKEEYVSFKLESKDDSRIYLAGEVDITTIDDTDGGDWSYEQNDGTYSQHIPNYWKSNSEDLSDEFQDFIDNIDWESFRQALCDFQSENRTFEYGDYYLHINLK